MAYETINLILAIIGSFIALGGGIAGFISVYILWKKSKAKLKIITTKSHYFVNTDKIIIDAVVNIKNEKDTPEFVTDVLASLRYNNEKRKKNMPLGVNMLPDFSVDLPRIVPPISITQLNLRFVFPNVDLELIDRALEAKFVGIYNNTPILSADERDFESRWSELPLLLRLDFHINGLKTISTTTGVFKANENSPLYGTFNRIDMGKIQHEFMKNG